MEDLEVHGYTNPDNENQSSAGPEQFHGPCVTDFGQGLVVDGDEMVANLDASSLSKSSFVHSGGVNNGTQLFLFPISPLSEHTHSLTHSLTKSKIGAASTKQLHDKTKSLSM